MPSAPQPAQLTDILAALRRNWLIVVVIAIVGLVLGVASSFAIPTKYSATSTVSVNVMNAGSVLDAAADSLRSVSMPTEMRVATSRKVAVAASDELSPRYSIDPDRITSSTTVENPDDSLILTIHFSGDSPEQAVAGADAVAASYLKLRRTDATARVERQISATDAQIADIRAKAVKSEYSSPIAQRSLRIQSDALGATLAELAGFDPDPGQVIGSAETPTQRSGPGPLALGIAGLFLGLFVAIPVALLRKDEETDIGGVDELHSIGNQVVLDGTKDTNRADTWDIAAFMLKIPSEIRTDSPFMIMVDAEDDPECSTTPGREFVDALARRGRSARLVDAASIGSKIGRLWPPEKERTSWAGEIIVVDTTKLTSDASKVAVATRSDSVLLARTTTDDAAALRRLSGLFRSKSVNVALTALFPSRPDLVSLDR